MTYIGCSHLAEEMISLFQILTDKRRKLKGRVYPHAHIISMTHNAYSLHGTSQLGESQ